MVTTKITSSREEFGLPEVFLRCLVVDSSLSLKWQSSSCDHHYTYLIDACPGALYQITNGSPF